MADRPNETVDNKLVISNVFTNFALRSGVGVHN